MNNIRRFTFALVALMISFASAFASEAAEAQHEGAESEKINAKEIIFEHLGDAYGWEVPFNHHMRIPLPVIVKGSKGWHVFSSANVEHGQVYTHPSGARYKIAGSESDHKGKIVELIDNDVESRPLDFSITKDVLALFIAVGCVVWLVLALAAFHRRNKEHKAPRRFLGAVESLVMFILDGVVRPVLGDKANRFAPYLLTVFMFIFVMNLLGLCVIFPGGANLTGNIAVTMVLAIITFLYTNLFATKHYWKEIFWPDVPMFLKFPIPIMQVIELFGIFTKPAALTVRLFANMMGGHIIVIVLTLMIFIFGALAGTAAAGGTAVVSMLFSVFMLLLDVLVSFIQAFVFTMLSTIFIAQAQESGHHEHPAHDAEPALSTDSKK